MVFRKIFPVSIAIFCIALLASCGKEEEDTRQDEGIEKLIPVTFTATQESGSKSSRTALASDAESVVWSGGDAISVFDGEGNNCAFTLSSGAGSSRGQFSGTVKEEGDNRYAVYPYAAQATISGNIINGVQLPAVQSAVKDGFDASAAFMTAHTTNTELSFKQVCCFVSVTIEAPCIHIIFKSNGSENIAGKASLTVDDGGVISGCSITGNGSTSVTLNPANDANTIPAGTYLIAILPQTLASGFTMECYGTDANILYREYTKSTTTFSRGKVVNMGTASTTNNWKTKTYHKCDHYYRFGAGKKEYVDLGLSVKWATCNLGAMEPWEYGDYYAWGATVPWNESYDWGTNYGRYSPILTTFCLWNADHRSYNWANAPYHYGDNGYYDGRQYWTKYYSGIDNKQSLDIDDDAAHVQWGGEWRMPTLQDIDELYRECSWSYVSNYEGKNITGWLVTGKKTGYKDKSIFLPASGYNRDDNTIAGDNGVAVYVPSNNTYYSTYFYRRIVLAQYNNGTNIWSLSTYQMDRRLGLPVRPVHP